MSDDRGQKEITKREEDAKTATDAKVLESKALSATGVHDALLLEGRDEINRHWTALAWSGLASGLTMGLSLMAEGALLHYLPEAPWTPLVSKLGYSFGFLAVTLGRQQLYTESTLIAYLPLAHDRTFRTLRLATKLWFVVLVSNLIGAFLFALATAHSGTFSTGLCEAFEIIGKEAIRNSFWSALVKGIYGGWLIAMMVWLMPAAQNSRIFIIILITWLLSVSNLTHIIAGSIEVFYLVVTGAISFGEYVVDYGIPVLIGNSIGGMALVAALNHAQVSPDKHNEREV